jgi:hypothetical protein
MPQVHRSPLSEQDLDLLEALAAKANAHSLKGAYTPLYVALDVGDASHHDAYMLLTWPAHNYGSARCAGLVFDYIAFVVKRVFGANMVATTPGGGADASAT